MEANGRYPENIIKCLRLREGLDEDDTHLDERFQSMRPSLAFAETSKWNGLRAGWDFVIKDWIKSIYGIALMQ